MNPGDVVLIALPQSGGGPMKLRPALILCRLPGPYQNVLVCGISTRLKAQQPDWDELIQSGDPDFVRSGLHRASVIRLSYLYSADQGEVAGIIGSIDPGRLQRLLKRISDRLTP